MAKVIMTSTDLVVRLKNLAARRTFYKNKYPYNLCYNNPDGRTSADCVNLYKALLNGYDVNNLTVGYFQSNLNNTGDCTEYGLISQCTDVSSDFSKLKAGEPRLLYMSGHIGGYIGENVEMNGHTYNCIECTGSWGGGILYSYVDSDGCRRQYLGGSKNGKWTKNGLMTPWVQYVNNPSPTPQPSGKKTNEEIAQEVLEGKWGNGSDRKRRLTQAGYDYNAVQKIVNQLASGQSPTTQYYTVKKGDTATGIAQKNGLTLAALKRLNPTKANWNLIYPGEKIRIK